MKILLIGKDGQVGWELQRALSTLGELITVGRHQVDLADLDKIRNCVKLHSPDFIVNAAAYTAVDKAEIEPEKARLINEIAVRVLAEEAIKINAWLIHYSTDYVFDGEKSTAYNESDQPLPLSVYGQTKLNGEQAIRDIKCKHLIFRSSWLYSIHGANFPLTILRKAIERDHIDVVADSLGAPTSASLVADITAQVIYRIAWDSKLASSVSGTYHLVASGTTSWYDYAKFLVGLARKKGIPLRVVENKIFPVIADSYKTPAKRPKNSQLSNKKLCDQFGLILPAWEVHVERFINELFKPRPF